MSKKTKKPEAEEPSGDALRTRHFLDIEREQGDKVGAKEMALTKKPRTSEKEGDRTKHFIDIEKGKEV